MSVPDRSTRSSRLTLCPLAINRMAGRIPAWVLQDKGGQDYLANPKLAGMDLDGPHAVRFTLH